MHASGLISLRGEPDAREGYKSHWFTVIHLVDRVSGQRLSIVNVHMLHGAVRAGRPYPGRPKHWRTYRIQMTNLIQKVQQQQGYGRVFIVGDFNAGWVADRKHRHKHLPFRSFRGIGYRSMWATERPHDRGTHRDALIDQVFSRARAGSAKVLFRLGRFSDHRPAVARYHLGPRR
jgi:endonuclease/exonuclease/phosphatase (EEP) superfamily protein YafD